jgi:tRNA-specific 2-thiouridylase
MMSFEMKAKKKVVAAMSGGVDSSVAAALLKQDGYEVIGMTLVLKPWDQAGGESRCCGRTALDQAGFVADILGIRHRVIDRTVEFETEVLRPAWDEYDRGRTPSPCVICNNKIKFQTLLDLAKKFGAEKIATGHYARVVRDDKNGVDMLFRGLDRAKDQSYFLFSLSDEQLRAAVFPLGSLKKTEVRRIAAEMGFANAKRPESQDACFVSDEEIFSEALREKFNAPARTGLIVDKDGNELGGHDGIHRFTVGQRKGLGVSLGRRAYVARINRERSQVVLSDDPSMLEARVLWACGAVWRGARPKFPIRCRAQIRSQHQAADATAEPRGATGIEVCFDEPQNAVAPGQAVVLYDEDRVLGGAWIDSSQPNH